MTSNLLPYRLERTVDIDAEPETVFRYFTESSRWAAWWGRGSEIDPHPGGRVLVRHPNGVEVIGTILEVDAPRRIRFTYGYASGTPIPIDGSQVEIALESRGYATRLTVTHDFAEAGIRDEHEQGWRYQFAVFANVVCNDVYADATALVDRWFAAWSDPDTSSREEALTRLATPEISFRDRFSLVAGLGDLLPHIAAVHRFMPGMHIQRHGAVRQCQASILADWIAQGRNGEEAARGTTVFVLRADNRIVSVTGFWALPDTIR
jgi:uncharacterized protein YndB with AHSA1/START domain